jgi:aminobenzoyl-glutamate utilization protein B
MEDITKCIDEHEKEFIEISDQIWEFAEPRFEEVKSAKILTEFLEKNGFKIQKGVADMPTAFIASYGSGEPIIAILGEYDALSSLSQKSNSLIKEPIEGAKAGHGCGHNLLGVGSLAGAFCVKEYLEKTKQQGTIRYYGCPAEEGGSGKTFMVRDGLFDDVDIALCWHPFPFTALFSIPTLANIKVSFKFTGRSAHAAANPHQGRSALDAVELMSVGVNYLREHIIPDARVHYAVTNTGGDAPNVVQANAEVIYFIRAPDILQVNGIFERVINIAKGAALMTDTSVEFVFDSAASNNIPNEVIGEILEKNLQKIGSPKFTEEEITFGKQLQQTFLKTSGEGDPITAMLNMMGLDIGEQMKDKIFLDFVIPHTKSDTILPGSTDVGDVSWVVPTNQFTVCCSVAGTPAHSWQNVTQGAMSIGHKGLIVAGKVLTLTAIDFLKQPALVQKAKNELDKRLKNSPYQCPVAPDIKPKVPEWVKNLK